MGIELTLTGRHEAADPMEWLERAAAWLGAKGLDPSPRLELEAQPLASLYVELHPAAEALVLSATPDGRARLDAKTGTAGPGYHLHVAGLARELGDALGVRWRAAEEGGFSLDDAVSEDELQSLCLDWLGAVSADVLELVAQGATGFALSLPSSHAFTHEGVVATPLGPRDEGWLRAVVEDPERGVDVFPWWEPGLHASYLRGLALTRMWTDVRWRAPLDDEERQQIEEVVTWLERAHGLDPHLEYPWPEWSELFELLGEQSLRATRAGLKATAASRTAPIGYRRRPVWARLSGGWRIELPGELAERWEERGTFIGWDAKRSLFFNSLSAEVDRGHPLPDTATVLEGLPPLPAGERFAFERGEGRASATWIEAAEGDDPPVHRLEAHAAEGPHAAVLTFCVTDPAAREWALDALRSLHREPG